VDCVGSESEDYGSTDAEDCGCADCVTA